MSIRFALLGIAIAAAALLQACAPPGQPDQRSHATDANPTDAGPSATADRTPSLPKPTLEIPPPI